LKLKCHLKRQLNLIIILTQLVLNFCNRRLTNKCISDCKRITVLGMENVFFILLYTARCILKSILLRRFPRSLNRHSFAPFVLKVQCLASSISRLIATGERGICPVSSCKVGYPQNINNFQNNLKAFKHLSSNIANMKLVGVIVQTLH